ncbi:hypothetical protein BDB00DRAFT_843914 [Zychaea mexicana]|uniref:uncharacterized protein n=1 Tax=Zychaea mexicana TaxID=64656 RepID=UPI0022FDCC0A|nr:uncharacterized protein BDB00DRAFT_843914 [Zychaea mexicana]KAI9489327.1 hypothetical protein BDB00DRAFT_843914 [Zychaea mexicana]
MNGTSNGSFHHHHPHHDEGLLRDASHGTLVNREQQLREEIAKLRREEQELREKDLWIKQNIVAVREKMMMASDRR